MHVENFREYCLAKPGTEESFPFDENTLVFKVMGKMFALTGLTRTPFAINLKCDPDRAIELREEYEEIQAGYHMNKKLWNTIDCEGMVSDTLLCELIDHSYDLVVQSLTKAKRAQLDEQ